MSNKSPFEIRSDILNMAKDYLESQQQLTVMFAQQTFEAAVNAGKATMDQWKEYVPAMYSIDDLIKKAQELYGFVAKKD